MRKRYHRLIKIPLLLLACLGTSSQSHGETIPAISKAIGTVEVQASIRYAAWWNLENSFDNFDEYCDSRRLANQPLGSCSNRLNDPLPVRSNHVAGDCIYEQVWWGTRSCTWLITGNIHYLCPEGYTYWATDHTRCVNTVTEYTCPPDQGWTLDGDKCTREYTIELDRDSATIEPIGTTAGNGKASQDFTATVKANGTPKSGAQVTIRAEVKEKSGYHDHHDKNRPKGTLSRKNGVATSCEAANENQICPTGTTGEDGTFTFSFTSSQVSGEHTLTATCGQCGGNQDQAEVKVKVEGLEPIPAFQFYALEEDDPENPGQTKVIGSTARHHDNHNLLPAATQVLMIIAVKYHFDKEFKVLDGQTNRMVLPPLLHVNDASLKWGGKFDIAGKWTTGSHKEHRRGTSVDLRANDLDTAIPEELFEDFEKLLNKFIPAGPAGKKFIRECTPNEQPSTSNPNPVQHNRVPESNCVSQADGSQDTNRHYHVRLLGEK